MRLRAAGIAVLALAGLVSGCTSSTSTDGAGSTASSSSAPASSASSSSEVPSSSPSSAPVTSSSSSLPSSSASSSSSAPPPNSLACTFGQLAISLQRGGAEPHTQIAGLIFVNQSAKTCTLQGFPAAQLLRAGATLGKPAKHTADPALLVTLHAGQSAEAQLSATTDCNAALSDAVRVSAPGQTATVTVNGAFRNCILTVGPVTPS